MIGFAVIYFWAAELGQALSVKPGNFATIWPPSGLYLAALLLTPTLMWPWLVAAAALANLASHLVHSTLLWVDLGFCVANALEAAVGALVLRRVVSVPLMLRRLKNTIAFVSISGAIAAPCGALAGALTVRIAFGAPFGESWLTWWIADLVGLLVFGPLVLAFHDTTGLRDALSSRRRILHAALFVTGTVTATVIVCSLEPPYARVFLLYPLLLWGAMRFGARGASAGLALVSLIVIGFTLAGRGPFAAPDLTLLGDMRLAQFFLSVAALSFLSLAAVVHERDDAARKLRDIIETIPTFAWTALPDGSIDFRTRQWLDYTGRTLAETGRAPWHALVHPDDIASHVVARDAAIASGTPFEHELRYRRADGQYRWFLLRAVPLRDERGATVKWYGVGTDIDDRKRAEGLLAGEKRILEMVARGDPLPRVLDGLCRLVEGLTPEVLASILMLDGDRLRHGAAPSLPTAYTQAIDGTAIGPGAGSCGTAAYRGEQVIVADIATDPLWADYRDVALPHGLRACWSTPVFAPDGTVMATFAMYHREPRRPSARDQDLIEQIGHLAGVAIQRTRAEESLRKQAALLGLAHDAILVCDLQSRITFWNPGAERTYGWAADEALGRVSYELLQTRFPVSREAVVLALQEKGEWEGELRHITREHATIVVNSRWSLLRDERGVGTAILEINRDVTERRQAESLIRQVFERAPDGVAVVGRDYRFQRVNRVYERSWKRPPETIVGMHVADLLGETLFEERVKKDLDRCFAGEQVRYAEWFPTPSGRQFLSVSLSPLRLDSERVEAALAIIRDLTDHMRAVESLHATQAELAHVTRVMTLGELAASIAHEVNQPLAAIVADATASLNWLAAADPDLDMVRETLAAIVKDGHRAADVVQRIRQLATKSAPHKVRLDVGEMVRDAVALVQAEVRRQEVSLTLDLAEDVPPVLGDRVQLQQVILNLVMNGIEAMATVGDRPRELVIRSGRLDLDHVTVAVQDSGVGLDPETIHQLFSAFFTTKPRGMGMGLSISRSIVEAHGGRLSATSNPAHGATFHVVLPVTR